jgi:hypothetical protein
MLMLKLMLLSMSKMSIAARLGDVVVVAAAAAAAAAVAEFDVLVVVTF